MSGKPRQSSPPPPKPRPSEGIKPVKARLESGKGAFPLFFSAGYLLFAVGVTALFLASCSSFLPPGFRKQVCGHVDSAAGPIRPYLEVTKHWNSILKGKLDPAIKLSTILFTAPLSALLALKTYQTTGWVRDLGMVHSAVMMISMAHVDMRVYDSLHAQALNTTVPHNTAGPSDFQVAAVVLGFFTFFPIAVMYRLRMAHGGKCGCLSGMCQSVVKVALLAWLLAVGLAVYEFAIKNVDTYKKFPSVADHSAVYWAQSAPHRAKLVHAGRGYAAQAYALVEDLGKKAMAAVQKKKA